MRRFLKINALSKMIKRNKVFIILFSILLVQRLLFIFSNFENFSWIEESYNGGIAIEVLNGLKMPLFFYQHQPYAPGAMIMGVAAVPFYWLFGESYIALKLLALLTTLLLFTFWYFLVKRISGEKVALFFSLLFIVAPPNSIKASLYALGNHYESALFTVTALYLLIAGLFEKEKDEEVSLPHIALAGLICGFASYFVLTFLMTVCLILIFWVIRDRLFFIKKPFIIFSGMFIAGFFPWIYNFYRYSEKILDFHGTPIYLVAKPESYLSKAVRFFSTGIPISFGFEGIKGKNINAYAYYFILIGASLFFYYFLRKGYLESLSGIFSGAGKKEKNSRISGEIILGLFPLLYCAVYIFSQFPLPKKYLDSFFKYSFMDTYNFIAYRYFFPLYPFFFFIIAYSAAKLVKKSDSVRKSAGYLFIVICLATSFLSYYRTVSNPDWFRGRFYAGSNYIVIGRKIAQYCNSDMAKLYEKLSAVPAQYKIAAFRGAGQQIGMDASDLLSFNLLRDRCGDEEKKWINEGFAHGFLEKFRFDKAEGDFKCIDGDINLKGILDEIPPLYSNIYYRNTGKAASYACSFNSEDEISESLKILSSTRERYSASFEDFNIRRINFSPELLNVKVSKEGEGIGEFVYRAVGRSLAGLPFQNEKKFYEWYEKTDILYREALMRGMAERSAFFFLKDFSGSVMALQKIPLQYREYFIVSAGEAFFWKYWYAMDDIKSGEKRFPFENDENFYRGIGRGIGYLLWWDSSFREKFISLIDEKYRNYCLWGINEKIDETYDITFQNPFKYFKLNIG